MLEHFVGSLTGHKKILFKRKGQGKQQGLQQGKQSLEHIMVRFVELHFPDLVPLARASVARATTPQQLQEMLDPLYVAHTEDEARAILLSQQK